MVPDIAPIARILQEQERRSVYSPEAEHRSAWARIAKTGKSPESRSERTLGERVRQVISRA